MRELADRVAVVTGGSRGIGRAVVEAFDGAGAKVVFCTRTEGAEVEETLHAAPRAAHVLADIQREADVDRLFDAALATYGRVDLVVHNAAVSRGALLVSLDEDALDEMQSANSTGAFLVARRIARDVRAGHGPSRLVNVGSLAQHGAASNAAYAATKGALLGLTRALAAELAATGFHAWLAVVGFVETALTRNLPERTRSLLLDLCPQKRAATCDEVAAAVMGLLAAPIGPPSGESIYITGGLAEIPA